MSTTTYENVNFFQVRTGAKNNKNITSMKAQQCYMIMKKILFLAILILSDKAWASWYDTIYITAPSGQSLICERYNGISTTRYKLYGDTATLSGDLIIPRTIIWPYTDSEGITHTPTYTVDGFNFSNCRHLTSVSIQEGFSYSGTFFGCTSIVSVQLPSTINYIEQSAFEGCTSLQNINIPNGVTEILPAAFRKCSSLQHITLPESINVLGAYTFDSCVSLTDITVPPLIRNIWNGTFRNCHALTSVSLPDSLLTIGSYEFYSGSEAAIWDTREAGAFEQCLSLTSIVIPRAVSLIGNYAFLGCSNLVDIVFPDTICRLCPLAFSRCGIVQLDLPDNIEELGYGVFSKCTSLQEVTIPRNLWHIGWYTFDSCVNLTTVNFNADSCWEGAETYCWPMGSSNPCLESRLWLDCPNFTTLIIGDNVKHLKRSIFSGASSITEVIIPSSVKRMEGNVFRDCASLTVVNYFADTMEYYENSFDGCPNLTSLFIGDNVKVIPGGFMRDVSSLTNAVIIPDSVVSIGSSAFSGCTFDTIVIGRSVTTIGGSALNNSSLRDVFLRTQIPPSYNTSYWGHSFNPLTLSQGVLHIPCGTREIFQQSIWYDELNRGYGFAHVEDPIMEIVANSHDHGIVELLDTSLCEDSTAVLHAIADSGYIFSHWSDGDTTNPRTLVLTHDTSLTAFFSEVLTDCDSTALPYTADFTQCWTAIGGATIIDSNHASVNTQGQRIVSPWMESTPGKGFLHFGFQRENGIGWEDQTIDERVTIVIENEEGIVRQWTDWPGNYSNLWYFACPGGPIRISFEYVGDSSVTMCYIRDLAIYEYPIDVTLEAPGFINVGDTVTLVSHATLPNDYTPDSYNWFMYAPNGSWMDTDDPSRTIISQNDSILVAVWNTPGTYRINSRVDKYNVCHSYGAYAEIQHSITVRDTLPVIDCDSIALPYTADFMQCWTAEGGATIISSQWAELSAVGQKLISPWMRIDSNDDLYIGYGMRRDTSNIQWQQLTDTVAYSIQIRTSDGVLHPFHYSSTCYSYDNGSYNEGTQYAGQLIQFEIKYISGTAPLYPSLKLYTYTVDFTIAGPTDAQIGDTVTFRSHLQLSNGATENSRDWDFLYSTSWGYLHFNNPDTTVVSVVQNNDSILSLVWHEAGLFNIEAYGSVRIWLPSGLYYPGKYVSHAIYIHDTTRVSCDSVTLPYAADFMQCWTAEGGATIIDPAHAAITSQGQKLTGPWMESEEGLTFIRWYELREGYTNYDGSDLYVITIEDENSNIIERWTEEPKGYGIDYSFQSPGGRIRVSFEHVGSQPVPSFQLSDVAIYQYDISTSIEGPAIAYVGDTVTYTAHVVLQNGESPDEIVFNMFAPPQYYPIEENDTTIRTILARTDSTLTVVWNTSGRYDLNNYVSKYDVFRGNGTYATSRMNVLVLGSSAHIEDSIIYTSATKDTVVGSHYELHSAMLPESVRIISDSAFFNMPNLHTVVLPEGLQKIGKMAFAWNQGITEITLPRDLQFVGDNAFWWDTNLAVVNFNADRCSTMCIGFHDDNNYYPVFVGCNNLATINIGGNVKAIPDFAFSNYTGSLRGTLVIPDSVTHIGDYAFYHSNDSYSDSLAIVIGQAVEHIGNYAFYCHDHVSSVTSLNPVPPTIDSATFLVFNHMELTVPCGSREAYASAQYWGEFISYGRGIVENCDGIEDAVENIHDVFTEGMSIIVRGAVNMDITVYDMMGRQVASKERANGDIRLEMLKTGVYIVRLGDNVSKKVILLR